jgi:ornithine cyclodeaminase
MAFGVLADVATGAPRLLLSELTLTTAIRTAAMSALAARVLARPNSRTMALIGNGAQSEFQALAFRTCVGIARLRLFDVDPRPPPSWSPTWRSGRAWRDHLRSTAEAVQGRRHRDHGHRRQDQCHDPHAEMVEPGMHINAVGGDCPGKTELHPGVLERGRSSSSTSRRRASKATCSRCRPTSR